MINPIIEHYSTGELLSERWYVNNRLHRTDGPAAIWYYNSGKVYVAYWFLNGKRIYSEDWLKETGYKWPFNKQQEIEFLLRFK